MTTPMYTGLTPCFGGCNGCNEGVTCLRTQRHPYGSEVHRRHYAKGRLSTHRNPSHRMLPSDRRILERIQRFATSKVQRGGSKRLNSRENSTPRSHLSAYMSVRYIISARSKTAKSHVTPLLHPLHPPKQGVSPVYIGVVTPLHPVFQNS